MAKNIIIVTNKKESEFDKFLSSGVRSIEIGNALKIELKNSNGCSIVVYVCTGLSVPVIEINTDIKTIGNGKIILWHGIDLGLPNSFDVGTHGIQPSNRSLERKAYEDLLTAWEDTTKSDKDKWDVFEEVWEYFSKKNDKNVVLNDKLNFLHQCLTPEGAANATLDPNWRVEDKFNKLKQEKGSPFGKNYIGALTALRDTLLNEVGIN
ncbi:MAG: hypothetical protein M0Q41_02090 [Bacteroidales bacterium]|nr:hypothetical protein [Acholeplasmataceae bacterium]MCK9447747.1 hypothetical protein [Bacteroidales bacterium]